MRKPTRFLAVLVLTGLLLAAFAAPTFAAEPTACWNNCGTVGL